MIQNQQNKLEYKNVISQYIDETSFTNRIIQVQKINSYHMYLIDKVQLKNYPIVFYQQTRQTYTLDNLLQEKNQLLPSEIKSIIWQITKLMLNCQEKSINHLRLYPKAIVFTKPYSPKSSFFIQIKNFSLGKQFNQVKQGKFLDFFQYMHPDISIFNKMIDFNLYRPTYDIWSLGIILYYLIYHRSPFCKQGKNIYSKSILKKYLEKQYQVSYWNHKYGSINTFIAKCLGQNTFQIWQDVKKWIIDQQEIYTQIDFNDNRFEEICEFHIRTMVFLSNIYCMVIDQCQYSPHNFWSKPVSNELKVPFHIKITEFTLKIMKTLQERFYRIYRQHFFLIRNKPSILQFLTFISQRIQIELSHIGNDWLQKKFQIDTLNLQTIKLMQQICAMFKIQLSQFFASSRKSISPVQKDNIKYRNLWKSMQIIYDYCSQIILIFNKCQTRMKYIYQQFYLSPTFETIVIQKFLYKPIIKPIIKLKKLK